MATAWIDEREPGRLYLARGVARPLWIGARATRSSSPRRRPRSRSSRARCGSRCASTRSPRARCSRSSAAGRGRERFRTDRAYRDDPLPSVRAPHERARASRLAALACGRLTGRSSQRAVRRDGDALLAQSLAHEVLERGPRAGRCRRAGRPATPTSALVVRRASFQSAIRGRRPSCARQHRTLGDGALELLVADRDVEAGLPERRAERAERVPDQRLRRHGRAVRVEVARRRRAAELLAELPQLLERARRG